MPYQRDLFARTNAQIDVAQYPFLAIGITKTDAAKFNTASHRDGQFLCGRSDAHLRLDVEKFEIVGHEKIVLINVADGGQNRLKRRLALAENRQIQRHVAERDDALDRAPNNPCVRTVKAHRGN